MDLQSTNSRLPRNTVVDPETDGNVFDVSARLLSIATYSVTSAPAPRGDKVIHLKIRIDEAEAAAVEDEVGSLEGGFQAMAALDPEELSEIGAGSAGGRGGAFQGVHPG